MRLWIRLTLWLVPVSIVPLMFTGVLATRTATVAATAQSEEQLERDAAGRADQVGRWTRDQAQFLAGWTQLYPSRLAASGPELQDGLVKAVYLAMPSAVVVALVDADGLPVVPPRFAALSDDRPPADGRRAELLVSRLPLTQALEGGVHVGDPYLPDATGVPSVAIAARATTRDLSEEVGLVLGAEIRLGVVAELMAQATDDLGFALLDGSGTVFAGGEHPLVRPRLIRALAGTTARFAYQLQAGGDVLGAVAPVPHTDWSLVVVRPANLVEAPAAQIRSRTLAVLQLAVAAALFLGWWLAQSLIDPIGRLRDAALAVADGEYGRRADIHRGDEVGDLARAFDHMSGRLAENRREILAQQREIEGFNQELQDRVDRRTRELRDAQAQLVRSGQLAAVAEIGAGLAHELNNPLAGVLGLTQVLRARNPQGPDARLLRDLEDQAERCREVVATMLRFSAGEVDPEKAPVIDLRDVLREATSLVRGPFRQRGVTLVLVESDRPLPVRLDAVHGSRILAQVLNALRAGLNDGATVVVSARASREERGEIEVMLTPDQVVGAAEGRHDDWMTRGLGLWVARRLLNELGGRLERPDREDDLITEDAPRVPSAADERTRDAAWRVWFPGA